MQGERQRIEREQTPEQIASAKIRDWISDPDLKFHFGRTIDMKRVLKEGILSHTFADRIKRSLTPNLNFDDEVTEGGEKRNVISIVDRSQEIPSDDPDHERTKDWWLKTMRVESRRGVPRTGYLLPSDMKVEGAWHHNESYAQIRIAPRKIDGIFVIDNGDLQKKPFADPSSGKYGSVEVSYAREFFGFDDKDYKEDPKFVELDRQHKELIDQRKMMSPEMDRILDQKNEIQKNAAAQLLSQKMGDLDKVTIMDFFVQAAKGVGIPLYELNNELSETTVIWPKSQSTQKKSSAA